MYSDLNSHRFGCFLMSFGGFNAEYAEEWYELKKIKGSAHKNNLNLSHRDILRLLPFDARVDTSILPSGPKTDRLFADRLSTYFVMSRHRELVPEVYFSLLTRDGERFILSYGEAEGRYELSESGIAALLRDKKQLTVCPSKYGFAARETLCSYDGESYKIDGRSCTEEELINWLAGRPDDTVVCGTISASRDCDLRIAVLNQGTPELLYAVATKAEDTEAPNWYTENRVISEIDENGVYSGGVIGGFEEIADCLKGISAGYSDLEYMCYKIRLTENGWRIMEVGTGKELCLLEHYNPKTEDFIRRKLSHKKRLVTVKQALVIIYRTLWGIRAERHGFEDFMYRNWRRALRADKKDKYTTRREKRWAHKRGFLSYHIKQYGLTEENYREYLSDYDYKYLRPINNRYYKWIWDKVSLRYMLDDYKKYLPEYYYNFIKRDGKTVLVTMQDTPEGYKASFEDVLRLIREKKILALKQTEGSHGAGFYKLEYVDGEYLVNGQKRTEDEMLSFLGSLKRFYNISEYIIMHDDLRRIYSKVACTVRVMVINRTGLDPIIENVYFRIGTEKTGFTDNIGSGGVFAYADELTGHFHDAEVIKQHIISPCPTHPDTGELIEGDFPHWDEAREQLLSMARYLSPIEYMGFDAVITPDGFKILEINTHQDLHRYPIYNENVHSFFMRKLELKKNGKRLA